MKTIFGPALLLGAIAIMPVSANAAPSVLANTQFTLGSTCSFNSSASGSVAASCGSYSSGDGIDARASFGSIGIRTKAAGPSSVIGTGTPEENDFWRGAAAMNDTLSFSVDSGTFRLFTDIAISLIEEVSGSFGGSSLPFGRNIFSVRIGDETIFQRRHEYTNSLTTGVASLTSTDDFGSAGRGFVDLAFTGGSLDLHASLFFGIQMRSHAYRELFQQDRLMPARGRRLQQLAANRVVRLRYGWQRGIRWLCELGERI
ncbi:MAG: hypothetical protein RIE06_05645 [Roseibium album]|uniref:hypothetical protein n=1 Tax=Roseibium album TaxID=311410 RepID=UPI0032EE9B30